MIIETMMVLSLLTGAAVFFWQEIMCISGWSTLKLKEKIIDKTNSSPERTPDLNESIRRMINITFGTDEKWTVLLFWAVTFVPAIAALYFMAGRLPITITICAVAFFAAVPLLAILARLNRLRRKSSREGLILLTELLDNYKINYFNIQQALEVTAANIEEAPNCRRLLFDLSKGLNTASGNRDIKRLLDDFKFAVDTSWAGILADNMYFALTSGIRITEAMEDLIKTLAKAAEAEEMASRENNESGLIIRYMVPACYFLTLIGGIKYFGLSLEKFIYYQFGTEAGLMWFTISAVTYGAAICIRSFLAVKKLDL